MLDSSNIFDGTLATGLTAPTGVAITTTRVSTNVLDLLVGRDMGAGEILDLHVSVTEAFVGGTSLAIDFEVCDTAGGTYLPILYSPVLLTAQLIIGAPIFRYGVPVNQITNATAGILKVPGRYLRLTYTVVGTYTAGAVFAYMNAAKDRQVYHSYPKNYVS